MTGKERVLYHQIHPLKLATDASMALVSLWLLWHHRLRAALLAQSLPPVLTSAALLRWADLEPQRQSALGRYLARYMSPRMQVVRFAGNAVMAVGAWQRRPYLCLAGLLLILFGWLRGGALASVESRLIWPARRPRPRCWGGGVEPSLNLPSAGPPCDTYGGVLP